RWAYTGSAFSFPRALSAAIAADAPATREQIQDRTNPHRYDRLARNVACLRFCDHRPMTKPPGCAWQRYNRQRYDYSLAPAFSSISMISRSPRFLAHWRGVSLSFLSFRFTSALFSIRALT